MRGFASAIADHVFGAAGEWDEPRGVADPAMYPDSPRIAWLANRPSLPPMFFLAGGIWAGIALSIELSYGLDAGTVAGIALAGAVLVVCSAALFHIRAVVTACLVGGLGLGLVLGSAHACKLVAEQSELLAAAEPRVLEAVKDARDGQFGSTAICRDVRGALVRVSVDSRSDVLVGDLVEVTGGFKKPSAKSARDSWRSGVVASSRGKARVVSGGDSAAAIPIVVAIRSFRRYCIDCVRHPRAPVGTVSGISCDDARMLLSAIVLGYTQGLYDSELYQSVKIDGLAHLVAVSGAHLVIVCGMVGAFFRRLPVARPFGIVVEMALIVGYLVLTGAPTSAVRAAIMAAIGMLAYFPGRRPYSLGALSCCVAMMLAMDPSAAFSASFMLSVSATCGIVLFVRGFARALETVGMREGFVCDALALTIASSLVTGPVSAYRFGQISLIAPIANILATPAFPFACIGGLVTVIAAVATGPPGRLALSAVILALQAFCWLLHALSALPGAAAAIHVELWLTVVLAIGLPAALWMAWPMPSWRLLAVALGIGLVMAIGAMASPYLRGDAITMLDVGQGDAILLQSQGRSLLIDTGTEDEALLDGLAACGAYTLDAVLVTHPDDDHCGSLKGMRGFVKVERVLFAQGLLGVHDEKSSSLLSDAHALTGERGAFGLSVGDTIDVGAIHLTVIAPDAFVDDGGNADSLILRMEYDPEGDGVANIVALFCGDAEYPQVKQCIEQGRIGDVDLYKVGHHGSKAAVDEAMLSVLKPEVSIVSVGEFNRYGHPAPSTIQMLEDAGSAVYRTDKQGAITCKLHPGGIEVLTER